MEGLIRESNRSASARFLPGRNDLVALLPRVPLAIALVSIGVINVLDGLKLPLARLRSIAASVSESVAPPK